MSNAGRQTVGSRAAQRGVQDVDESSMGPEGGLLRHAGSDSALLGPLPAGTSGSTSGAASSALEADADVKQGIRSGGAPGAAYEPGYREPGNVQPAPWQHHELSNGSAVPTVREVSRAQWMHRELPRMHAELAVRHVVHMSVVLAALPYHRVSGSSQSYLKDQKP